MPWLTILELLFKVVNTLTAYLHDRQLLDAGRALQMSEDLRGTLDAIQRAHAALDAVRDDPDSVRNDPDNIDNQSAKSSVH